jgi:hypothetical protein
MSGHEDALRRLVALLYFIGPLSSSTGSIHTVGTCRLAVPIVRSPCGSLYSHRLQLRGGASAAGAAAAVAHTPDELGSSSPSIASLDREASRRWSEKKADVLAWEDSPRLSDDQVGIREFVRRKKRKGKGTGGTLKASWSDFRCSLMPLRPELAAQSPCLEFDSPASGHVTCCVLAAVQGDRGFIGNTQARAAHARSRPRAAPTRRKIPQNGNGKDRL